MQVQKTVFISYRRTNIYMARAVYANLRANGYDAFLDYQSLDSGDFSQSLLNQIVARAHFVVILTPSALERCTSSDDWMRKEIEYAIQQKRNVIPLMFEGFKFEDIKHYLVSARMKMLTSYTGLRIPDDYFEEAMTRLCSNRYLDRDIDTVLHPVAAQAIEVAYAAQVKADAVPVPTSEQLEAEKLFESGYHKSRLLSNYEQAIEDYTRAIALKPDYAEAYFRRGNAYANKNDKISALKDWKKVVQLRPDDQRANIIRSAIAVAEDNFDLALTEAEIGIVRNPNYDEAYFQRAAPLYHKGDFDGAITDYTEAIRLNPQFATSYYNRGIVRKAKNDFDGAIADYTEAIRLNPQFANAYHNRGLIRKAKNDFDGAIADYTEAIRLNPQFANAYHNRGLIRKAKNDFDQAIADFDMAIRLNPKYTDAYLCRGNVRFSKKDYDQAIVDYKIVLRIDPNYKKAKENLEIVKQIKRK